MMGGKQFFFLFLVAVSAFFSCKENRQSASTEQLSYNAVVPKEDGMYATLVAKNGTVVFEQYHNGKTSDSLCNIQSLTKGLMSILVGIGIEQGYIKSVEEPIAAYLPNEFIGLLDEGKEKITIKQLLNQTSGLAWAGHLEHEKWLNSENPIAFVLDKDLENKPGEKYNYNSGATHLLSVVISEASGMTTLAFANKFLFGPLDIKAVDWQKRNKGYYDGSGLGLAMKPADLMKIGQLLTNKGNWKDKKVVSEKWVDKLFDEKEKSATKWGLRNSKHGFCWYLSELNGDTINYGMGYGGQFIIMVPSKHLIVVTTHNHDTPNGIDQQIEFLNRKLPALIEKYGA